MKKYSKLIYGIASHDAGGADILSEWLINQKKIKFFCSLKGPAINIFKKKNLLKNNYSRKVIEKKTNILLTSTSWPNRHEVNAIKYFKLKKKKTISFLDHWSNYKIRFLLANKTVLPDIIWVADKFAKIKAKKTFPNLKIVQKKNYLFERVKKIKIKKRSLNTLLYISSPIFDFKTKKFKSVSFKIFLNKLKKLNINYDKIIIRPHPRERLSLFKTLEKNYPHIKVRKKTNILKEIISADAIAGINSISMVYAILMKKKVYSFSPKKKIVNFLPYKNIINI